MYNLKNILEQAIDVKAQETTAKELQAAKVSDNRLLTGLLTQKQNLLRQLDRVQSDIHDLDIKIAQAKASPPKVQPPATAPETGVLRR